MIKPEDFQAVGESLAVGKSVRVGHWCGEGDVLKVDRKPNGISAWCHRCATKGWLPITEPLSERIARLAGQRQADDEARQSARLPGPGIRDPQLWPMPARLWLYKAGLSNDEIVQRGFYYVERMRRVVMPVYLDGELVYWQARALDSDQTKYLNPSVNRDAVTYRAGKGKVIVLTEDILSACKVSRVTEAWSIMGVQLSDANLTALIRDGRPVVVALDPDPPGIAGSLSVLMRLQMVGIPCVNVTKELRCDPKLMNRQEIEQWIFSSGLSY